MATVSACNIAHEKPLVAQQFDQSAFETKLPSNHTGSFRMQGVPASPVRTWVPPINTPLQHYRPHTYKECDQAAALLLSTSPAFLVPEDSDVKDDMAFSHPVFGTFDLSTCASSTERHFGSSSSRMNHIQRMRYCRTDGAIQR